MFLHLRIAFVSVLVTCASLVYSQSTWQPNGGSGMIYYNDGNVGIGTINPAPLLSVYKNTNSTNYGGYTAIEINNPNIAGDAVSALVFRSGTVPGAGLSGAVGGIITKAIDNASQYLWLRAYGSTYPIYIGANTNDLVVTNGKIGMGTTSPTDKLHVIGSISSNTSTSATTNGIIINGGNTNSPGSVNVNRLRYGGSDANANYFTIQGMSNVDYLTINNGNVGIGTTDTKGYKFAVNGSAIFTKAVVKSYTAWPDYVFDKDYQLMSLDSVESFIQTNKHLPNVPSAKEVNATGVDLGENQKILLQKTEELTLYLIQQNKIIEALKSEINDLKKEVKQLSDKND